MHEQVNEVIMQTHAQESEKAKCVGVETRQNCTGEQNTHKTRLYVIKHHVHTYIHA